MSRNVVVAGAGPAGLLLVSLLLQRNRELETPLYNITLIDNRENLAKFTDDELKKRYRSWMLSLANHGCAALRECSDSLYADYVFPVGIEITGINIHIGTKEIKQVSSSPSSSSSIDKRQEVPDNIIIDRNFAVAAISRYVDTTIKEGTKSNGQCTTLYEHQLMYVDYENRRVLCRPKTGEDDFYIPYDLLVGCDGVRSCVREAFIKRHSTFEMDIGDIFSQFKVCSW
jgi:2-polyprenyl-6-methoxyphenol hydroxylase-like FAD-dependent oxidoreductase